MAPGYRTNAQTRRGNRGAYPEHDDFEGLPVRQWRQEWVNVTPPQQVEAQTRNDIWAVELPYGMPKDTQLLPPHSQELLRAARSGRLYKRPAPADDDDADPDPALEKGEKKEDVADKGYTVKVWKQVPRTSEGPTVSHLAKRRKDTITLKPKAEVLQSTGPMITRATIRRVDAAGNPYEQTITLSEGQPVDGEIVSTSVIPAPVAPVEVQPQQVTPARRKPPPPRRKPKGPGRGRKKGRLAAPPSTRPPIGGPSTETVPAALQGGQPSNESTLSGTRPEDSLQRDSEPLDHSIPPSDDEDGDEGDDGDEGEEGNGDVDMDLGSDMADRSQGTPVQIQDEQMAMGDDATPSVPFQECNTTPPVTSIDEPEPHKRLSPGHFTTELAHAAPPTEGSPLKNVALASPASPSRAQSPASGADVPPADPQTSSAPQQAPEGSGEMQLSEPDPAAPVVADAGPGEETVPTISAADPSAEATHATESLAMAVDMPMEDAPPPVTRATPSPPKEAQPSGLEIISEPISTEETKPSTPPSVQAPQEEPAPPASTDEGPASQHHPLEPGVLVEVTSGGSPAQPEPQDQPSGPAEMVAQSTGEVPQAPDEPAAEAAALETSQETAEPPSAPATAEANEHGEKVETKMEEPSPTVATPPVFSEATAEPPRSPPLEPTKIMEDEDEGPDFLSGLEAELDRQEELNRAAVSAQVETPILPVTLDAKPPADVPEGNPPAADEAMAVESGDAGVGEAGAAPDAP
ncbi:hypothetical protein MAPG_11008 [Magnaporthiopsis poae ATCC 64411]|uniref:Apopolysialoglycoprotein n=1 Tax=Magnaporthiopsis poae (strain ATCC 64411 / 73-15) TaxID=644358 RepID=A0A0C4EE43_MAGP6|nr:hypothetical protein MAPG_11008 [Magnaporthiopsis poae ATCC 64411]